MSKTNYQTVYGTRIYPIEYIGNEELTESELNYLLDNKCKSLLYSLIIGMFKFIKSSKRNYQIVKMIQNDNKWQHKIKWTAEQCEAYEQLIIQAYKNLYQYRGQQAISMAQWFIIHYGLDVEGNNFDLNK